MPPPVILNGCRIGQPAYGSNRISRVSQVKNQMKLCLARFVVGRMLLHLGCLCRGGHWHFHAAGLQREWRNLCLRDKHS